MSLTVAMLDRSIAEDVLAEHERADAKHGAQTDLPDGTSPDFVALADFARTSCQQSFARGEGTWADILAEEFFEALAEEDPAALRAELVQVSSVAQRWIRAIDLRGADAKP